MGEKMTKYYHFTKYSNLESISKNGLIPQTGDRCKSIGDEKCAVFISKEIKGAVRMYCGFYWYYSQFCGDKGLETIESLKEDIAYYDTQIKKYKALGTGWEKTYIESKERDLREIEHVKQMLQYTDFNDYIGDGCYLSISGLRNVDIQDPKDCLYKKTIDPSKINVVVLRNIETGDVVDSIEQVIAYFMSTVASNSFTNELRNVVEHEYMTRLFAVKWQDIYNTYNRKHYVMEEVPIVEYLKLKHQKTLK